MLHRYQNLKKEDKEDKLFNVRGWLYNKHHHCKVRYQLCSGPACRLSVEINDEEGDSFSFVFGLLFLSLYLTIPKPKWWKWGEEKGYGFYWHQKECRIFWGEKSMESGFGWHWYFRPLDLMFGKSVHYNDREMHDNSRPIHFKFRGEDYQLDKVYIQKWYVFRTRVPFGLWHREGTSMRIDIKRPPMHGGKGTTSYNCGDDGTFGMSGPYKGPKLKGWNDREKLYKYAVEYYCKHVYENIKKRGRAGNDDVDRKDSSFEYIGFKSNSNDGESVGTNAKVEQ